MRKPNFRLALTVLCLMPVLVLSTGCTGYGPVSDRAYELSKALYSVCNTRSEERLEKFESLLDVERESGVMTAKEIGWLQQIVDRARAGGWGQAAEQSRQIMEDQVSEI